MAVGNLLAWHTPILGDEIDPYLEAQPSFVYAMPVQVVVLGICVTLLSVLLVHLLFTVRYHLPLSKLNYCCQTSAVVLTLGRTIGELHVLMAILIDQPKLWPYEFLYIEVELPPDSWTKVQLGAWLALQALSILVMHATHIQFLTMLFPSALEARLILGLLGPLAVISSFLTFTDMSSVPAVGDLGDAIRNTANSTLTLLYTLAIFIWGLTLNRARAWRTDGGTAAFGIIALILGVTGTAINFLEVKEDRMRWLPDIISCVLLWQSWMGFWWWVGAGMWTGEAEDVNRKEERARRREDKKRRRREAAFALQLAGPASASASASATAPAPRLGRAASSTTTTRRRARAPPLEEEIEMDTLGPPRAPRPALPPDESVSSGSTPPPVPHVLDPLIQLFRPFLARLRVAHDEAVVGSAALPPGLPDDVKRGWGIRALMMRGKRERGERRARMGVGAGGGGEVGAGERRAGFGADGAEVLEDDDEDDEDDELEDWEDDQSSDDDREGRRTDRRRPSLRQPVDPDNDRDIGTANADWRGRGMDGEPSWTWSGAIKRWRLKDVQHF